MRGSLLVCLQLLATASASSSSGPAPTIPVGNVPQAPLITEAPILLPRHDVLLKRDAAPGICGWIEGYSQNPYSCTDTSTCFWNTEYHVIGCGVPTSAAFLTSCVNYADLSASCNLSCSFNPSINRCVSTLPYCVNITLGGADQPYTAFACGPTAYSTYPEVQLTYTSQTTLNLLPRYLNADGSVSYGTATPAGYSASSTSSSSTSASTSSSPSSSSSPSTTQTTSSPSSQASLSTQTPAPQVPSVTPSPTPSPSSGSSTNIGAIVGGVVGGVGGIALIAAIAVFFIIRNRRKKREEGLAQNAGIAAATENKPQYPNSPGYQGSVAPAYQQPGAYGSPQAGYYQPTAITELQGGPASHELAAPQQQYPHLGSHELES